MPRPVLPPPPFPHDPPHFLPGGLRPSPSRSRLDTAGAGGHHGGRPTGRAQGGRGPWAAACPPPTPKGSKGPAGADGPLPAHHPPRGWSSWSLGSPAAQEAQVCPRASPAQLRPRVLQLLGGQAGPRCPQQPNDTPMPTVRKSGVTACPWQGPPDASRPGPGAHPRRTHPDPRWGLAWAEQLKAQAHLRALLWAPEGPPCGPPLWSSRTLGPSLQRLSPRGPRSALEGGVARRYQQSTRGQAGPQWDPDDHRRPGAPGLSPTCGVGLHGVRGVGVGLGEAREQRARRPHSGTHAPSPGPREDPHLHHHPTSEEPGEEGESRRPGPHRQPRAFQGGAAPPPGHSRASGGETGLGGGRGVVTAAGTRGWGQGGVSSPRYPPTPQDEQPGVCSQISPAWAPRAHPTGSPPPLPTARPVLRSFDAPGKGGGATRHARPGLS